MDINGRVIGHRSNYGKAATKVELKAADDFMAAIEEYEEQRQKERKTTDETPQLG